jgi:RNA polymerase sigma factor (sigma-70 family)
MWEQDVSRHRGNAMPGSQLEGVIRHIRKVARQGEDAQAADAELLERFIAHRDQRAFELLVHRHGPMVLGVCQRVLLNGADAEDAFQATFLVLVRKATSIIPRTQVGNWLHGVAHKTALKAKAMNRRRRVKEREAAAQGRNATDETWESLLGILDGELSALPEKYRTPIVLCDLEGLSYREAAARLKCPQGTLSGRLTRARSLLARRVARHHPAVTGAALATLLARDTSASIPPALLARTTQAGTVLAAGKTLSAGVVSPKVASLAQGVLKMLLLSKPKSVTACVLLLALIVAAGWTCSGWLSVRAAMPGDNPRTQDDTRAPIREVAATHSPSEFQEAEFVFRGAERGRRTVSLVVAGTSAPVLCLPMKDDLRVLVGGRHLGIDGLRAGDLVAIRLDSTNSVIQDIRALQRPDKVTVLKSASDLAHLKPPSTGEVLRAMSQAPRYVPAILKVYRDEISVVTERLVKQVDPPRFFPLVGVAELHHYHWKCTVYYSEIVESGEPFAVCSKRSRVEVVYIDKDYLVPSR